jgi:biopolymer transport protein ExbB
VLVAGPLVGLLGTVIGMIRTFETVAGQAGSAKAQQLASGIQLSLWPTVVGLALEPIGLAVLITGIVWLLRMNRREREAE